MHIHGGQMNPSTSLSGAHGSAASALAARRAEETRKKLFSRASELDAATSSEGGWMVTAWAGGNSAADQKSNQGSNQDSSQHRFSSSDQPKPSAEVEELPHTASARPVSFWA
jgi:hypothetical protein